MIIRSSTLRSIAVIAWIGCGAHRHESPASHESTLRHTRGHAEPTDNEPPHNDAASTQYRLQLVSRAEQAAAARWPLDYQRPFITKPVDEPAAALYLEACQAGDKPSCWIAASMDGWGSHSKAGKLVLANCRGGDIMSCRALVTYETPEGGDPYGNAPGWAGRSETCMHPFLDKPCDMAALRQECAAGFAFSCFQMFQAKPPDDALQARVIPLARDGCRASIESDCRFLNFSEAPTDANKLPYVAITPADRQLFADRMCVFQFDWCGSVSTYLRERGELARARDLEEQACQYGGDQSHRYCLQLGEDYINRLFPEPVLGRGEALIAWACSKTAPHREPICEERTGKHQVRRRGSQ